ncbi:site-2 protease family protein [Tepidibacter thalassicus]|uniref:Zn-dependent protease (Includes SpoIVFB) n=1 Tax=Tepidibacter thalassicus DSM 15285 TaxID=1123350 RepID=A0A1M5PY42_9FIRM|nr:site-2 protease family protein [Tepidibacter thalassicus]SHH06744.1 Zn-dependent protease (includes SpoIVFB) [Tepidibacter thalassicus DSM 15285]
MIIDFLANIPGILLAVSVHEFGHGAVAYLLGDDTAKNEGRLTIDPIKHIDPIGFLMLIIAHFGWAKPVPVNSNNLKNKRLGMFLISLAGPVFNIIMAIITLHILNFEHFYIEMYAVHRILVNIVGINIGFAVFNLLPIPPLDGSKILLSILPNKLQYYYWKYENIGTIVLFFLVFTDKIGYILTPILNIVRNLIFTFI